jgi:hypothetical protein
MATRMMIAYVLIALLVAAVGAILVFARKKSKKKRCNYR